MDFVRFSLDDELVPVRKEKYEKRYFYRSQNGILWYDSLEEAEKVHGHGDESGVKSFLFVPGSIYDNPVGLEQNKEYIATLKALPYTESRRLLNGAWVMEQTSGFFKRHWVTFESYPNYKAIRKARCWDLAFSEPSEARPVVDATAGVLMSKDADNIYTVEDVVTMRKRVHEVEQTIFETAERDGRDVIIGLPKDPGATAGAYCQDLARRLGERGFIVRLIRPEKGKVQRFLPFASVAEAGYVKIVRGDWTENYLNELEQTDFGRKSHDDQADATSDCFYILSRQSYELPNFSLPSDLSVSAMPQFGFQSTALPTEMTQGLPLGFN